MNSGDLKKARRNRSSQDKFSRTVKDECDLNFQFKTDESTSLPANKECLKLAGGKIHSTLIFDCEIEFCFARIGLDSNHKGLKKSNLSQKFLNVF